MRVVKAAVACWLFLASLSAVQAGTFTLGVIGDSLSDEYQYQSYSYARNWVEQLVSAGKADAGAVGTYGGPRRTGYAYNWALYGTTIGGALHDGQNTGLLAQVNGGEVSYVAILCGANDFFPSSGPSSIYYNAYHGLYSAAQVQAALDARVAGLRQLVGTFAGSSAKCVLSTIPSYNATPYTWDVFGDSAKRQLASEVVEQFNAMVIALGAEYGIPVVDLYAFTEATIGTDTDLNKTILVGGTEIYVHRASASADSGFVDDKIHPNTVMQGLIANLFLTAFNTGYGEDNTLFRESEILAHAGLSGGEDTLFSSSGLSYRDFVIYAVPEPSSFVLAAMLGLAGLALVGRRRTAS